MTSLVPFRPVASADSQHRRIYRCPPSVVLDLLRGECHPQLRPVHSLEGCPGPQLCRSPSAHRLCRQRNATYQTTSWYTSCPVCEDLRTRERLRRSHSRLRQQLTQPSLPNCSYLELASGFRGRRKNS